MTSNLSSIIVDYMRRQIPVNLTEDLIDAIEKMAELQHRTRSNMIEALLIDALTEKRVEYRETRQLASLDRIKKTRDTRRKSCKKSPVDDMPFDVT